MAIRTRSRDAAMAKYNSVLHTYNQRIDEMQTAQDRLWRAVLQSCGVEV